MRLVNLPPQLRGTPDQQIALLRNYLVTFAQEHNELVKQIEEKNNKEKDDGK